MRGIQYDGISSVREDQFSDMGSADEIGSGFGDGFTVRDGFTV